MLLDGGFRVVAPDMLGYGDSARLPVDLRSPLSPSLPLSQPSDWAL